MGFNIKKNDTVLVVTGKGKGKKGRVLSVMPAKNALIVERANIIKKHMKPSKKYTQGGIIEKESPLHISNVMLICPRCSKPAKIANMTFDDGKKLRVCKKCKEPIDQ